MPHECTNCNRIFPDGSKEMLSGCPNCGGNRFQFAPDMDQVSRSNPDDSPETQESQLTDFSSDSIITADESDVPPSSDTPPSQPVPQESVSANSSPQQDTSPLNGEDNAQASARTEFVSPNELPSKPIPKATEDVSPPQPHQQSSTPDERPTLEDLRKELNDQFESIKIVEPGQYELNLMELYDREEYIVSLQEDGRYVINVPGSWHDE